MERFEFDENTAEGLVYLPPKVEPVEVTIIEYREKAK